MGCPYGHPNPVKEPSIIEISRRQDRRSRQTYYPPHERREARYLRLNIPNAHGRGKADAGQDRIQRRSGIMAGDQEDLHHERQTTIYQAAKRTTRIAICDTSTSIQYTYTEQLRCDCKLQLRIQACKRQKTISSSSMSYRHCQQTNLEQLYPFGTPPTSTQ